MKAKLINCVTFNVTTLRCQSTTWRKSELWENYIKLRYASIQFNSIQFHQQHTYFSPILCTIYLQYVGTTGCVQKWGSPQCHRITISISHLLFVYVCIYIYIYICIYIYVYTYIYILQFPLMHFITVATHCSVWESKERVCRAHSAVPYHLRHWSSPEVPVHLRVHCAASLDACTVAEPSHWACLCDPG